MSDDEGMAARYAIATHFNERYPEGHHRANGSRTTYYGARFAWEAMAALEAAGFVVSRATAPAVAP